MTDGLGYEVPLLGPGRDRVLNPGGTKWHGLTEHWAYEFVGWVTLTDTIYLETASNPTG